MDFQTVLSYILAIIETAALIGAMVYGARALHENKLKRTKKGKKGAKSNDEIDKAITVYKRYAFICLFIYLALNVLRNYSGLIK